MPQQVLGDLIIRITGQNAQFDQSIDQSKNKLNSFNSKVKKAGKNLTDFGKKATTFVTLPILGIGTALAKTAIDAEETDSKFKTVFRSVGKEADKVAKNLSKNFGLSSTKAQQLLSDTGDLLSGFGFTGKAALNLSKQVNELAVDLASFTNYSGGAEGASAALTKALLGERESIKSLGIAITEADIKKLAKDKGIKGNLDRQTKAALTLELAIRQSKNAIGDFSRTQDSAANQLRILMSDLQDVSVELGKELIPLVKDGVTFLRDLIKSFSDLDQGTKNLIFTFAGIAAAIGPATSAAGGLLKVFGIISAHPIGAVITALAAGFVALGVSIKNTVDEAERLNKIQQKAVNAGALVRQITDGYKPSLENARKAQDALNKANNEAYKAYQKVYNQQYKQLSQGRKITQGDKEYLQTLEDKHQAVLKDLETVENYIKQQERLSKSNDADKKELKKSGIDQKKILDLREAGELQYSEFLKSEQIKRDLLKDEAQEKEKARIDELEQKRIESENRIKKFTEQTIFGVLGAYTNLNNSRLAQIDQQRDAEGKLSDKLRSERKKLLEANKAAAITESIVRGVLAVQTTLAQFGWPAGIIPAGIVGGLALANTAAIASQPLPKLKDGGLVLPSSGGTPVIMAEAGVPEFAVPERQDVMTRLADRIVDQMNKPNVTNVTNNETNLSSSLNIDGKEFKAWINGEMRKGNIIVPKRAVRK